MNLWWLLWIKAAFADKLDTTSQQCGRLGPTRALTVTDGASVAESSGMAMSQGWPGHFFTHDDAGGDTRLYVFEYDGDEVYALGAQEVLGATNTDWEDIASGPCPDEIDAEHCLWIGDIGDNDELRSTLDVWVVPEQMTEQVRAVRCTLQYEGGDRYDAESLLISPDRTLRIVTKEADGDAKIYRIDNPRCDGGAAQTLWREAELVFPGEITGASMHHDGTSVVLRGRAEAWRWSGCGWRWSDTPERIPLGAQPQGESVAILPDGGLLTTSEGAPMAVWETPCVAHTPAPCARCGCDSSQAWVTMVLPTGWMLRRRRRHRRLIRQEERT